MIIGDEKLNRRELSNRAKDRRIACSRAHLQSERVPEGGEKIFI
jgi:hypothetical protein